MEKTLFGKHPDLVVKQENPFNAAPPPRLLTRSHTTPADLFFVRSHGDVPEVNAESYRLEVNGDVLKTLSLSLEEIRKDFERVTISATLQCAGNRREELMAVRPIPHELPWGVDAIGHAAWAGIRLRDVLAVAGVEGEAGLHPHLEFGGLDETERLGKRFNFGGSIPLAKGLSPEVILAYEMNGEPLMPVHGFPLRVIVPGYIGARSVKWLSRITVQAEPSQNYFQSHAYRLFEPHVTAETVKWEEGLMLGEMNVTSVICSHAENEQVRAGVVTVQGYALTGGDRQLTRVEVSRDGGESWAQAELLDEACPWAWVLWKANFELQPGKHQLVARAVDSSANEQPQDVAQVWNFKGYMNNAWHRVNVDVVR